MDANTIIGALTLAGMAVVGLVVSLGKTALEAGVRTSAEEGAKAAVRSIDWSAELGRELEKARGLERQELRFKSYGGLWKQLRPLALYDDTPVNRATVAKLSGALSDWYFSECGGLLLTADARECYFALQYLLRAAARASDWSVERSAVEQREVFRQTLVGMSLTGAVAAFDYFTAEGTGARPEGAARFAKQWRDDVKALGLRWRDTSATERFAILQQTGSVLRTVLVVDVQSRLA